MTRTELGREWRQFRLLSRDSVRRLLARAFMSRDSDPVQFALWAAMLALTPPFVLAVRKLTQFAFLQAVAASDASITARILTAERTFFVLYGMLAAALVAAMTWEALYPDRTDQEIVGVLPVRPRTLAAARLGAAIALCLAFAALINLPPALVYAIGSLAHDVGPLPRVVVGHVIATMGGCAFVFLALIAVRGIVAICASERLASAFALVLQFATIVLLVEILLFLPYVVLRLVTIVGSGVESALPPVWFIAVYFRMADGALPFDSNARLAAIALSAATAIVLLLSLAPAAWMGRRALHVPGRTRIHPLIAAARTIATLFVREPVVRSLYLFGLESLARNRRHLLVLARYLGLAIAAAVLSVLSTVLRGTFQLSEPRPYLLAIPLVFVFFAIFGLRTAIAIPVDVEANWPFRLATPTVDQVLRATRLLIATVGVLPIILVWLGITASVWPPDVVLRITLLDVTTAFLVMEASLLRWDSIPFAAPYEPAPDTLKSRWMWYLLFLLLFAKGGASLELSVAQSSGATAVCVMAGVATIAAMRLGRRQQRHRRAATFENRPGPIQSLNLSEAAN